MRVSPAPSGVWQPLTRARQGRPRTFYEGKGRTGHPTTDRWTSAASPRTRCTGIPNTTGPAPSIRPSTFSPNYTEDWCIINEIQLLNFDFDSQRSPNSVRRSGLLSSPRTTVLVSAKPLFLPYNDDLPDRSILLTLLGQSNSTVLLLPRLLFHFQPPFYIFLHLPWREIIQGDICNCRG